MMGVSTVGDEALRTTPSSPSISTVGWTCHVARTVSMERRGRGDGHVAIPPALPTPPDPREPMGSIHVARSMPGSNGGESMRIRGGGSDGPRASSSILPPQLGSVPAKSDRPYDVREGCGSASHVRSPNPHPSLLRT